MFDTGLRVFDVILCYTVHSHFGSLEEAPLCHCVIIKYLIISGSQILNIALLVIDITKGMETQTAECLVVAEITCDNLIVVLNKIDLLPEMERNATVTKFSKRMRITLGKTKFKYAPIVSVSASPNDLNKSIGNLFR